MPAKEENLSEDRLAEAIHREVVTTVEDRMLNALTFRRSANFFKVMGNETRFKILWALNHHEMCVCDLSILVGMTKSAISHQLAVLRAAELVTFRRDGKLIYYSIADAHVSTMLYNCVEHATE